METDDEAERLAVEGMRLLAGIRAPHDRAAAADRFARAAALGHAVAANQLGAMLEHGEGVAKDEAAARHMYRLAAERGLAIAQFNLGFLLHMGRGGDVDLEAARHWYGRAAAEDEPTACLNLGILVARGEGGPRDVRAGYALMERAARMGEAAAAFNLGTIHAGGHDVAIDFVSAVRWFRVAEANDHPQAAAEIRKCLSVMSLEEREQALEETHENSGHAVPGAGG